MCFKAIVEAVTTANSFHIHDGLSKFDGLILLNFSRQQNLGPLLSSESFLLSRVKKVK